MKICNNRIVFALVLAVMLTGGSLSATAQSFGDCYFTSYGDFICPKPAMPSPAEPAPEPPKPDLPEPEPVPPSKEPVLSNPPNDKVVDSALFKNCTDGIDNDNTGTVDIDDPACAPVFNDPVFGPQAKAMNAAPASSGSSCNLIGKDTLSAASGNFSSKLPASALWDGSLKDNSNSAGGRNTDTLQVEFDFKQPHMLSQARIFGEDVNRWVCRTWQIETRLSATGPWQAASGSNDCFGKRWFEQPLSTQARYVRLTVRGDKGMDPKANLPRGTQFREFQLIGAAVGGGTAGSGSGSGCTTAATNPSNMGQTPAGGNQGQAISNAIRDKLNGIRGSLSPAGSFSPPVCSTSVPGQTYTVSNTSELNSALSKAGPGDEIVLKDGRYQGLRTRRGGSTGNPIVIRAENPHKAVIEWPHSGRSGRNVSIDHSNIVIRDLKVDGESMAWDNFRIGGSNGNPVSNIVVEGNWLVNGGNAGFGIFNANNVVIRHNFIDKTGIKMHGEGIYIASAKDGRGHVNNVEIYGNIIQSVTNNFVDYKKEARNVNVHHNIFDTRRNNWEGYAGDGVIRSAGSNSKAGNYFKDNIVRNATNGGNYILRLDGNRVDVTDNVFMNNNQKSFIVAKDTTSAAIIKDNISCNGPSQLGSSASNHRSNNLGASMSACKSEEQRILNEMKNLPSCQ